MSEERAPDPRSGVQPDGSWVPVAERQRPPFEPGNQVAVGNSGPLKHGAYSPRKVEPLAMELVDLVLADQACAHAHAPQYRPALFAWARAEAEVQLLTEYLAKKAEEAQGPIGDLGDERVRSAFLLLHRAETRATSGRTRLGFDPLSRARLGRDKAAAAADTATVMGRLEQLEKAGVRVVDGELVGRDGKPLVFGEGAA